ncbi:MAG: Guanylate kinase [Candidatus Anoxychlamydiales bacterium]|nr:Guanylate kinase [Candidatus Anoxychlamydiales bacterium]
MTQKLLGNLKKGLFFIISAPAGAGKTTLTRMLTKEFESVIESVSFTSRKPRKDEKEGFDYFFVTKEEFEKKIKQGDFLEYAKVYDHYYGTSKSFVEKNLNEKKHVVLVIDTQGALKLKNKIDCTYIFISPPSIDTLRERMKKRADIDDVEIEKRISWANEEMKQILSYDYNITNIDLDQSYEELRSIFIAEERKVKNLKNWE